MIDWKAVKKAADESFDERWTSAKNTVEPYRFRMDEPITEREAAQIARLYYLRKLNKGNDSPDYMYDSRVNLGMDNGTLTLNGNRLSKYNVREDERDFLPSDYDFVSYEGGKPVGKWFDTKDDESDIASTYRLIDPDGNPLYGTDSRNRDTKILSSFDKDKWTDYGRLSTALSANADWGDAKGYSDAIREEEKRLLDAYYEGKGPDPGEHYLERREMEMFDPNGYLSQWGLRPSLERFNLPSLIDSVRTNNAYMRYLYDNNPAEYERIAEAYGEDPLTGEPIESARRKREEIENKRLAKINKRWGSNQISLTPEQYAYYDAKRQMQANPGSSPHWNAYLKAKQPMKPNDLGQVRKYTVQQRMMNTPQPNGRPKTPAMLQQEWQQENRRRMQEQKSMYNGEIQGMKNRTGAQPTPTNTWNY